MELTLAPVVAAKYLVHDGGCFGVGVQLCRLAMQTALLEAVNEVAQKFVSVFLPPQPEVLANGCRGGGGQRTTSL